MSARSIFPNWKHFLRQRARISLDLIQPSITKVKIYLRWGCGIQDWPWRSVLGIHRITLPLFPFYLPNFSLHYMWNERENKRMICAFLKFFFGASSILDPFPSCYQQFTQVSNFSYGCRIMDTQHHRLQQLLHLGSSHRYSLPVN